MFLKGKIEEKNQHCNFSCFFFFLGLFSVTIYMYAWNRLNYSMENKTKQKNHSAETLGIFLISCHQILFLPLLIMKCKCSPCYITEGRNKSTLITGDAVSYNIFKYIKLYIMICCAIGYMTKSFRWRGWYQNHDEFYGYMGKNPPRLNGRSDASSTVRPTMSEKQETFTKSVFYYLDTTFSSWVLQWLYSTVSRGRQ